MEQQETLTENARLMRNAYMRKWKKTHREKVKQFQIQYWNKKANGTEVKRCLACGTLLRG